MFFEIFGYIGLTVFTAALVGAVLSLHHHEKYLLLVNLGMSGFIMAIPYLLTIAPLNPFCPYTVPLEFVEFFFFLPLVGLWLTALFLVSFFKKPNKAVK
jgi:hypothetical protein